MTIIDSIHMANISIRTQCYCNLFSIRNLRDLSLKSDKYYRYQKNFTLGCENVVSEMWGLIVFDKICCISFCAKICVDFALIACHI